MSQCIWKYISVHCMKPFLSLVHFKLCIELERLEMSKITTGLGDGDEALYMLRLRIIFGHKRELYQFKSTWCGLRVKT